MNGKKKYRVQGYSELKHKRIDCLCTEYTYAVDLCDRFGLSTDCITELQWLWYPYVSMGYLTLVYGDNEKTVSSFLLEITSRLSTRQIGDNPDARKGILFEIGDKDPGWIKRELEKRGGDTTQIGYMNGSSLNYLLSEKDKLKEAGVRTIVLGSVEEFIMTSKLTMSTDIADRLKKLRFLAQDVGCAMILGSRDLHPKGDEIGRNQAAVLKRIPRSVLEVIREGDGLIALQIKNNLAAKGNPITWTLSR